MTKIFKKVGIYFAIAVLFVTLIPSQSLAANSNSNFKSTQEKAIENIEVLDSNLYKDKEGLLSIDEDIKNSVSMDVYEYYSDGVDLLNQAIKEGKIDLDDNGGFVINTKQFNNFNQSSNGQSIQPLNLSWTGYTYYLTNREARDLQYALEDRASQWTLATILASGISGAIPNPGTLAAASASALMALGNDWVAGQIDRHITSRGVSMKIQWLPYPGLIIRGR
jgi:hypothetical protein